MRVHFLHRNIRNIVVILEKGNLSHPWCPRYNMMFPCRALNGRHLATAQCFRVEEQKIRWLEEEE